MITTLNPQDQETLAVVLAKVDPRERDERALVEAFENMVERHGWCPAIEALGRVCDGYEADAKDKGGFGWEAADAYHQRSAALFSIAELGVE